MVTVDHHVEVIETVLNGHVVDGAEPEAQNFDGVTFEMVAADVANVAAFQPRTRLTLENGKSVLMSELQKGVQTGMVKHG